WHPRAGEPRPPATARVMTAHTLRSRRPRGDARLPRIVDDPDVVSSYLEDAAHFPGGRASGVATISSEAEAAALLKTSTSVLAIGAQSSLTGGATPMGDTLLSTARLNHILEIGGDFVRVEAGVTLADLDAALERANRYYPPAPTFFGAFIGGRGGAKAPGP